MTSPNWQQRFSDMQNSDDNSLKTHMTITYIVIGLATVLLNNLFLSLVSLNVRIMFGFTVSFIAMAIVAVSEMVFHIFAAKMAHSMLFVMCAVTAIACAVQQSSFYGFGSMFPKKYTQAIMVGEGLAGFLAAVARIFAHLTNTTDNQADSLWTIVFFLIPAIYIVVCFKLYLNYVYNPSPLVHYYVKLAGRLNRRSTEVETKCGVASTGLHFDFFSFFLTFNCVFSLNFLTNFISVYPFMVCIALTYVVTASLHPSIITEIISCKLEDWMPILLLLVFSTFDVIGKVSGKEMNFFEI